MSAKLVVVVRWAERIASAILIVGPAIRQAATQLGGTQPEADFIRKDEN